VANDSAAEVRPDAATVGADWQQWVALCPSWLAAAWLVSKAQWFWSHRPDLQFGWVVLLLSGYIFWEAWEKRPAPKYRWTLLNAGLVALGLGFLFVVQIYQAAFGTNAASVAGLALVVMLLVACNLHYVFGGAGVRRLGFAFAFLLIALPLPSVLHNVIVGGLQSKIAMLNVEILNLGGVPAERTGSLIRLPNCVVGIDEACSGIRSLQSAFMATLFIGYLTLRRASLRTLLLLAGLLLALVGNLGRSLFLSLAAHIKGAEALHTMHDAAGWSILAFTAAGVGALAWLFSTFEKHLEKLDLASRNPPVTDTLSRTGTEIGSGTAGVG
jgi:exosortase